MRKGRLAVLMLFAAAFVALCRVTAMSAHDLARTYGGVSVRVLDGTVSLKALKAALAEEEGESAFTCTAAWSRGEKMRAEGPSLGTQAELRAVLVYGDMRQAAPMKLLCGSFPAQEDMQGCLIDAQSAWSLFHSIEVTDVALTLGQSSYTVRGVVETYEPMLLMRSPDGAYENLEFRPSTLASGKGEAEAFMYRHALSGDYAVVENGLYARILQGLSLLPAALLLLAAAVGLVRLAVRRRGIRGIRGIQGLLPVLAGAVCIGGAVLILRAAFYWPETFLPTQSADFAFWGKLAEAWSEDWKTLCLITPLPKEIEFYRGMRLGLCAVGAQLALAACLGLCLSGGLGGCSCRAVKAPVQYDGGCNEHQRRPGACHDQL